MTAHVKTYALEILSPVDSSALFVAEAPTPEAAAKLLMEAVKLHPNAIGVEGDDAAMEALAELLIEEHGAEFEDAETATFEGFGDNSVIGDRLEDSLFDIVNKSNAIREWAAQEDVWGYSNYQHHADEIAMSQVI